MVGQLELAPAVSALTKAGSGDVYHARLAEELPSAPETLQGLEPGAALDRSIS
jgi:hypothetical protein